MNYEVFKNEVINRITEYLPESYKDAEISINPVVKNNSIHLDGLMIHSPISNVCPSIYLNHYFEKYENGMDFDEILNEIASVRIHSCDNPFPEIEDVTCLEKVKSRIQAKLTSLSRNEEYLKGKPYTQIADLAVIYYIEIDKSDLGNASIVITDNMLTFYGISVEELHSIALANMRNKEASFLTIAEVLKNMIPESEGMFDSEDFPMYVLTNSERINGASMLLDTYTMDQIADKIGTNFYILPSSIHETIFIPKAVTESRDLEELVDMVVSINCTQVGPDEVLSDHIYEYSYSKHTLEIAA